MEHGHEKRGRTFIHSIHKRHGLWLDEHPNVFFHYTPTNASWLNMVEIWFGILTLKSLRGASFSSTQELGTHIKAFQKAYKKQHSLLFGKNEKSKVRSWQILFEIFATRH